MKVFLTGGTGFIGGRVAAKLRERGDEVVALVRDPARARDLEESGAQLVRGDLSDRAALAEAMTGCDAAIHGAAVYKVGIPASERPAMYEANVVGTENALGAALDAGIPRVVYVSTIAAFGNTRGQIVDEDYEHPGDSYTSYYEQTKVEAHRIAKRLIAEGLPCVIVQPGTVYGPGDHSVVGKQISDFARGRLPAIPFPELGFNMTYIDDAADGILLALDRGELGRSYVLGGEITRMGDVMATAARITGRKPPRAIPSGLVRALRPVGPLVGKLMGQPPNLRELVASADGVTFWGSHDRAVRELGYSPRPLEEGLRETLAQ
ncbi:MAG TPA: NAD-dependent epimerase/dehydratase family protein [Solirubrobacterales bacterium]